MRYEQVVAAVKARRRIVATAAALLLVTAGAMVALVGDGPSHQVAARAEGPGTGGAVAPAPASSSGTNTGAAAGRAAAPMEGAVGATSAGGASVQTDSAKSAPVTPSMAVDKAGAKVIKTANLRVEVGKGGFRSAFDRAASIAARYNGFVASSSEATVDDKASEGTLTIRVPADQFDAARRDLAGLGKVSHQELGGQDVTAQIVDYDARIRSLQAQEQAFSTLLGKARSIGEVLEVQGQLFNVRQQIEQLQAERGNLDAQASMATITATVFEPGAAVTQPKPTPATGLAHSWQRAWDGAVAVVGGTVIVIGYLLPLAVLGLLGWGAWRLATRRRRPSPATTPAS
jgi:hypothetical protein